MASDGYIYKSGQCHPGLIYIFNFWHSGTLALSPERQSARISEIKNVDCVKWQSVTQLTALSFKGLTNAVDVDLEHWSETHETYGVFTPPTRQFCLVRVGGVNTPLGAQSGETWMPKWRKIVRDHLSPNNAFVTKQYNSLPIKCQWCSLAGKVAAGLVESNGSPPPGLWLIVTCGLTAKRPASPPSPTLVSRVWSYLITF